MNVNECSGRTLAFLGDAVWSLAVREYLVSKGDNKGKKLQAHSISYVSAKAQSALYEVLHEEGFFTEEEEDIFHRGRNSSEGNVPKNTDVQIYRISTGFEAVLGALRIEGKNDRVSLILEKAVKLRGEKK